MLSFSKEKICALKRDWMILIQQTWVFQRAPKYNYVHTTGNYGMKARNFGIIRFIHTLLSMVQLGSNRLKMVHIKASHITIWGLYFLRSNFPYLQLFRYLQAAVFVSTLCSFSIFLVLSISVMYLTIFWQRPLFCALLMTFVICLIASFICSFCCSAAL